MPISLDAKGITQITDFTLMTDQSVEKVAEVTDVMLNYDATVADEAFGIFDPTFTFDFSGLGDLPAGLAVATDGGFTHEALSGGKTLVTSIKTGEFSDRRNDWSCSGENCPGATAAE